MCYSRGRQGLTPCDKRNKMKLPPSQAQARIQCMHAGRSGLHQLYTVYSGHAQEPHATVFAAPSSVSLFHHGSFQVNTKDLLSLKQKTVYAKMSWFHHNKSIFCEVSGKRNLLFFSFIFKSTLPISLFIIPIKKSMFTVTPTYPIKESLVKR